MASDRYPTYIRMDKSIHSKLLIIAEKEHRSLNSLMVVMLIAAIEEYEKKHGEIKIPDE